MSALLVYPLSRSRSTPFRGKAEQGLKHHLCGGGIVFIMEADIEPNFPVGCLNLETPNLEYLGYLIKMQLLIDLDLIIRVLIIWLKNLNQENIKVLLV